MEEMGKVVLEFDVEKVEEVGHGIEVKYLRHFGERVPYKAVLKDGQFVAIVGSRYVVIPNERIIEAVERIAKDRGYEIERIQKDDVRRVHIFVRVDDGVGFVVHNSIDMSMALMVNLVLKVGNARTIIRTNLNNVYRKHTKSVEQLVDELDNTIENVVDGAAEFKEFLARTRSVKAKDVIEGLEELAKILPKKYTEPAVARAKIGLDRDMITLGDIYEQIANEIWKANVDMRTKLQRYKVLNEAMAMLVGMEDLFA